jgi:energy-coupling factor transport system ATP-binding protein
MNNITLANVTFSYQKNTPILKNLSCTINSGTFLGIIGVNGSGKSTFSYLLNSLIPQVIKGNLSGEILIDGVSTQKNDSSYFAKKVGMVFQNPDFSLFNLTVKEELEFGLDNLKISNKEEKILHALSAVGMQDFLTKDPKTLSFGQKQKICLASVLALDTKYIVLDEPVAMLDYKSSLEVYKILTELNNQGKTIIAIEHDTDFLQKFAKEVLILNQGEIIAFDTTEKIFSNVQLLQELGIKVPKK